MIITVVFAVVAILMVALYLYVDDLLGKFLHAPKPGSLGLDYGEEYDKLQQSAEQWHRDNQEKMVYISSGDGLPLAAHLWDRNADTTAIFVHGYGHTGEQAAFVAPMLERLHCNILAPDCRGHGESGGEYIGLGWPDRFDVLSWVRYISELKGKNHSVVLLGLSMGAAAVISASGELLPSNVKGICADCGFSSLSDLFSIVIKKKLHLPKQPAFVLVNMAFHRRFGYGVSQVRPLDKIKNCRIPALIIHGELDEFIPCSMAEELFAACPSDKEILTVAAAGHALSAVKAPDEYFAALSRLFNKCRK